LIQPTSFCGERPVSLQQFEIKRAVGCGGFSRVFLVRSRKDGRFYAMKLIGKELVVRERKQRLVMGERNVMVQLSHPFLAKLHCCFESPRHVVFLLEYYPAGELFALIKRCRKMNESFSRFYIVEILLGLEELHANGIAYRDIKPENILLDREGHVCIADFGMVKFGMAEGKAFSFCGSPEYMPPEIIAKRGHTLTADFYSLGALLYELVTGLPPFYSRDPEQIYEATVKSELFYPAFLSESIVSLLQGLLCK
jgi:serum/glucocorticoid-regulated kinase 2